MNKHGRVYAILKAPMRDQILPRTLTAPDPTVRMIVAIDTVLFSGELAMRNRIIELIHLTEYYSETNIASVQEILCLP